MAETALYEFRLGNLALARDAAREAIRINPADPLAVAMKAFLLLADSKFAAQRSAEKTFIAADVLGPDGSDFVLSGLESEAALYAGESQSRSFDALKLFLEALDSWPRYGRGFELEGLRQQIADEALRLAWRHGDELRNKENTQLRTGVLDQARRRERESETNFVRWERRASDDLLVLGLYRALDAKEHVRFGATWLKRLTAYPPEHVLPLLNRTELAENILVLAPADSNALLDGLRDRLRVWAESKVAVTESQVALERFRGELKAGHLLAALEAAQFGALRTHGTPRFALLYGGLRAGHGFLAQALSAGRMKEIDGFLASWGTTLAKTILHLSKLEKQDYLIQFDEDGYEWEDISENPADLLPSDPNLKLEGSNPGEMALVLEKIANRNAALGPEALAGARDIEKAISKVKPWSSDQPG